MSAKITVHRGTHSIGGSIVEISDGESSVLVDFGSELAVEPKKSTDAKMADMIKGLKNCKGVLFTHYHGDHIGLLAEIPDSIPIYLGETALQILLNIRRRLLGMKDVRDREKLQREYDILCDKGRTHILRGGEPVEIEKIRVTPMETDHSALGAFMFLIEAGGKTILHSGDFRTHGWLGGQKMREITKRLATLHENGGQIDALIVEGTMMGRLEEKGLSEAELRKEALDLLAEKGNEYAFLICSSTNVDSLAAFCSAANALNRPFLVNDYVYDMIGLYRSAAGKDNKVYDFRDYHEITYMLEGVLSNGKQQKEVLDYRGGFLMLVRPTEYYQHLADLYARDGKKPLVIYSMWEGYLDQSDELNYKKDWDEFLGRYRKVSLHSGGHARKEDIEALIAAARPREYIVPIHTEKPELFHGLKPAALSCEVTPLNDGDTLQLH